MKVVILAGGVGTRLSEETDIKPKPMIEIGGKPILWQIMKIYSHYGFNDFIVCLGYKGYIIKEYFANYFLHMSDVTFDMVNNKMEVHQHNVELSKQYRVDWNSWVLFGTGSDNPLTLNWGDQVHLLIKYKVEQDNDNNTFATKEDTTSANRPYIEITYQDFIPQVMMY